MKKLLTIATIAAMAAILAGCGTTKARSIELRGMYASESGQLAIGEIEVQAIPEGTDAALIKYEEDNGWLAPSMKLHTIGITLTGTNAVASATGIVEAICRAYQATAPSIASAATNANYGTTMMDQMGKATEARKAIELGRQAVKSAADAAKKEVALKQLENAATKAASATAATTAECKDGSCTTGECKDGECEYNADETASVE